MERDNIKKAASIFMKAAAACGMIVLLSACGGGTISGPPPDGTVNDTAVPDGMDGADHAIIVDAVEMGRTPGEVAVFTPAEVKMLPPGTICSLHHIGLEQVLEFAGLMGFDARLHVVGIQPESVSPGLGLSATAAEAVPVAIAKVRQLLREDGLALAE